MLLSRCITSIPATMATLFMSPLAMTGVAGKRIWLVFTEQVVLFTWFTEVTLRWAFTWDTNILMLFAHSESSIHIPLLQTSLSATFQLCSFQVSDQPAKPWPQPMNQYIITHLASFPSKQNEQPNAQLSVHRENYPSPLSFRGVPERGFSAAAVHFTWCLYIMQNHLWIRPEFFLPQATHCRELHMRP